MKRFFRLHSASDDCIIFGKPWKHVAEEVKPPPENGQPAQAQTLTTMDIYVGNLAYATNDDSLKAEFEKYGAVSSARVCTDRISGRSKGFGFVEMPNDEEAQKAIDALNGKDLDGRPVRVNKSQPKPPREERGDRGDRGDRRDRRGGGGSRW